MSKPRVVSYTICHYGADYIGYALKSVINHVDQALVVYTPHPSHGHQTSVPCPETKEQIWAATEIDSDKVKRYELKNIFYEGPQRDYAVELCRQAGAELILVVDSDEIWSEDVLAKALDYAWQENKARSWLCNLVHLWRGFNHCCRDQGWPVRILDLRHPLGTIGYIPKEFGDIFHFGYAVPDAIANYKWKIHGHRDELRRDWFETKWNAWPPPPDCHPTNSEGFWNPEPFDKNQLPEVLHSHPFFPLERID